MSQLPMPPLHEQIRSAIQSFLQDCLQSRRDRLEKDQGSERIKLSDYEPENWIADKAQKADKIQLASHTLKFTHPEAAGSNLNSTGNPQASESVLGTHTLGTEQVFDVWVATAAYLPIYTFLNITVDGQTLLERCITQDPALSAAFCDNPETAKAWMTAFANLGQPKGRLASHSLAKQIYWPLGKGQYHLLSPLFPTSLAHAMWVRLREDRFSDKAKNARQARDEHRYYPHGYRKYPGLAVQKFGGTKPLNISHLNSTRQGKHWLLPSLPPEWKSDPVRPPLGCESVFQHHLGHRRKVRELVDVLKKFLESLESSGHNNIHIRDKRAELAGYILDELLQFAADIQSLDRGWSQSGTCKLNLSEQCWLDPKRAETDPDFADQWQRGEWRDEVCHRFGQWLNNALRSDKLPMGLAASLEWQKLLEHELRMIRLEL